ncbi:hypothetical protein [Streptomonospora nanhaiensis]|uniref:hypothetical protein n=1 Tax=Streptomonospora nanhaiensis TaxID=1323731 RepID=UPI001C381582|nr:hypothetical protein [Streptomonospora nanhaiensis]MBV2361823.1 hypothetical protein [Streptomonospora nanhaiensis]
MDALASRRCAHEIALLSAIEDAEREEAHDDRSERYEAAGDQRETTTSGSGAIGKMPYDFSAARIRYEERALELLHAQQHGDTPPDSGLSPHEAAVGREVASG